MTTRLTFCTLGPTEDTLRFFLSSSTFDVLIDVMQWNPTSNTMINYTLTGSYSSCFFELVALIVTEDSVDVTGIGLDLRNRKGFSS